MMSKDVSTGICTNSEICVPLVRVSNVRIWLLCSYCDTALTLKTSPSSRHLAGLFSLAGIKKKAQI